MGLFRGPAPRPCSSCPYRCDVPSGVWSAEDYAKLAAYDEPTGVQPPAVFLCHQSERDDPAARVCAGWVGCHRDELLALRLAGSSESDKDAVIAALTHTTDVPLFRSGAEAAAHGLRDLHDPSPQARALMDKIGRRRPETLL